MPITPPENSVTGQIWSWALIDCGPSIGLIRRPLFNDKFISSGTSYTVQPFDWRLVISVNPVAAFEFFLPSVAVWLRQPYGQFPLQFKDGANFASTFPITITPFGTDTIDGLNPISSPVQILTDGGSLTVQPKSDLTGWNLLP